MSSSNLSDPEFHAHAFAQAERAEAGYRALLDTAAAVARARPPGP